MNFTPSEGIAIASPAFWSERWVKHEIGWHIPTANPVLVEYLPKLIGQPYPAVDEHDGTPQALLQARTKALAEYVRPAPSQAGFLLPLCGKTIDLVFLARLGFRVVGIEIVEQAIQEFFQENNIPFKTEQHVLHETKESVKVHTSTDPNMNISIFQADLFAVTSKDVGALHFSFDRGSFVAMQPALRTKYAVTMTRILAPTARILAAMIDYEEGVMAGPPFNVTNAAIEQAFSPVGSQIEYVEVKSNKTRFSFEMLERIVIIAMPK
ncbi:hypothetical protein CAOG_08255 [Capsaspora owczarzaki ATCC 30864]|uniref:Thiopurine S-methyltransferase n=1 Tax=Capsaspora owczarzaki (strain ATCC 30864) TaxID=595528 RepID=A0A0D2WY22_CAPO3|nr:hypothetical protein CAOG_08255 [Capsaspora owczarzaki ATCC 30864]KJE98265.1 hypothetical protein CAOG_008255 [Capsaspora owczarzaki ATCC 30864]|eukprot:XP_004342424.1 hypothetical protein CAOG_08255 [Capsaspora owczarzaki ATCC 30864]